MRKAFLIGGALVASGVVAWLVLSETPSADKIRRLNAELREARQLGLSTQAQCAERLGKAILKTTDEAVLSELLATVPFDRRFADAILAKIKNPEKIETIAKTFKPGLLDELEDDGSRESESLYDAILNRLPDDDSVERVVIAQLSNIGIGTSKNSPNKGASSLRVLASGLFRRIVIMDKLERTETLLVKMEEAGLLREVSNEELAPIAIKTRNPVICQASGINQNQLELVDLVAKWNPDRMTLPVRDILIRGGEIRSDLRWVEIVKRFDPDFTSESLEDWVSYGKEVHDVLAEIEMLDDEQTGFNSGRRNLLTEKKEKAQKTLSELKTMISKIRTAMDDNDFATIMAACSSMGVYFDASDPDGTGWRLGNKIRERYQQAENEIQTAERSLSSLDREKASRQEEAKKKRSTLEERLRTIRQQHKTPEARQKANCGNRSERKTLEENFADLNLDSDW